MPIKDPEKRREYNREYQRQRRAGGTTKRVTLVRPKTPEQIETAKGLLSILGHLIGQVLDTEQGDVFMRARTTGYLISIGLKAVEVADLEGRLTALENKVMGDKQ